MLKDKLYKQCRIDNQEFRCQMINQTNNAELIIKEFMLKYKLRFLLGQNLKTSTRSRNVRFGLKRIIVKSTHKNSYNSIDQMWEVQTNNRQPTHKVIDPVGSLRNWYNKANQYWNKAQATYDGVLSGFGNLSQIDIRGSEKFLNELRRQLPRINFDSILDCGAGIGRISKQLFCRYFKHVDIIDQCEKYVLKANQILRGTTARHFYCSGLQDFKFQQKYDIIWIQWVLSHLTDQDAVQFFRKARNSLNQNGVIVMKQNHSQKGFLVDKEDYSVTRSAQMYRNLIERAGLKIIKQQMQVGWPQSLYDVKINKWLIGMAKLRVYRDCI